MLQGNFKWVNLNGQKSQTNQHKIFQAKAGYVSYKGYKRLERKKSKADKKKVPDTITS